MNIKSIFSGEDKSDISLISDIRRGNIKAFDKLFNKYYKNLCRFAWLLVHDEDIAQSLVQNVFVKIWERRFMLAEIQKVSAYLTTMVRNQCYDYNTTQKKYYNLIKKQNAKDISHVTEEEVFRSNFEEQLLIAVSELPERCRIAFEYSRFENKTNREIAELMDISIKGVEALIGRSLKFLKENLKEFL